jgi:hemerythrin
MSLFEWDKSFQVDIVLLDNQHKKLVNMINDLHDAMRRGDGKSVMQEWLITHIKGSDKLYTPFLHEKGVR